MKNLIVILILISIPAIGAGIVDKRKENFQTNKESMKNIYQAIKVNDLQKIIESSNKIELFASEMVDYFPVDSSSRGASDDIWTNFDGFKERAQENETAAKLLKNAAQQNKIDELNELFNELSMTCKSCHRSFKN